MILKGSQRGGGEQLAAHLMNDRENDHVTLHELRGFMSEDLSGAFAEMHAMSKATQCRQFMFSLSLNPPKDAACDIEALIDAVDRSETGLGLEGHQRAVVVHEKQGRRHAHVVWSRIDANELKAAPMPFFKNKLAGLSKELYLEHGWELPEGHRENGWKNPLNFTLAEWQQAKRLGLDPREIKQLFADAWRYSDGLQSFKAALEDRGYFLCRGDRRGFVATDVHGEVFSVSKMVGIKTKDMEAKLGPPDGLEALAQVKEEIEQRKTDKMRDGIKNIRKEHQEALLPLEAERTRMVQAQRLERERLRALQDERLKAETTTRQGKFRKGVRGVFDILTGRAAALRRENDSAAYEGHLRDVAQREAIYREQLRERSALHERIASLRRLQRQALIRLGQRVADLIGDRRRDERTRHMGRELRL